MVTYGFEFDLGAERDLLRLGTTVGQRVLDKVRWLAENIEGMPLEALTGRFRGTYKLRVGDYRVLFRIDHSAQHIKVVAVGHRSEVYDES